MRGQPSDVVHRATGHDETHSRTLSRRGIAATEALVALAGAAGSTVAIRGAELKPGGCSVMVVLSVLAGAAVLAGVRRWAANPDAPRSAHVVAAAIVIPAVARKLSVTR